MRLATILSALLCVVLLSAAANAQRFLEQLERTLDAEQAARDVAGPTPDAAPVEEVAPLRPSDKVATEPGYLGLIAQFNSGNVQVEALRSDTPAQRAGLREGDIIKTIDGHAIKTLDEMAAALAEKVAGDEVVMIVERKGLFKKLPVTLGRRNTEVAPTSPAPAADPAEPAAPVDSLGALRELERILDDAPDLDEPKSEAPKSSDSERRALRERIAAMEARMESLKRRIGDLERALSDSPLDD